MLAEAAPGSLDRRRDAPGRPAAGRAEGARAGRLVWLAAVAVVALCHVALAAWLPATGVFSVDESALRAQAALSTEGVWTVPAEDVVRETTLRPWQPMENAAILDSGFAPYGKHPLAPAVVRWGSELGGDRGARLPSMLGALAAAVLIGRLVERFRPGLGPLATVVAGVGSPILFHSQPVWAHGPALAAAAVAALGLVRLTDRTSTGVLPLLWVGAGTAVAVLLRTDGLIFAVAAAIAVVTVSDRRRRQPAIIGAVVVLGAAAGAVALDGLWVASLGGAAVPSPASSVTSGPADRVLAIATIVLGGSGVPFVDLGRVVTAIALGVAGWRHGRGEAVGPTRLLLTVAAIAGVLTLPSSPANPGIVAATPILAWAIGAGVARLARRQRPPTDVALLALLGLLHLGAVSVTVGPAAGGGDWGARYASLALVGLLPAAFWLLTDLDLRTTAAIGVCVVAASAGMVHTLVDSNGAAERVRADLLAMVERHGDDDTLLVLDDGRFGRLLWREHRTVDLALSPPAEFAELRDVALTAGYSQVVVISPSAPNVAHIELDDTTSGVFSAWRLTG